MKHKVADLEGALLDAAVAKAEGWSPIAADDDCPDRLRTFERGEQYELLGYLDFSLDWALGGPLIEREGILIAELVAGRWSAVHPDSEDALRWCGLRGRHAGYVDFRDNDITYTGPTPLIAAMRAFVASKFGDEVELP